MTIAPPNDNETQTTSPNALQKLSHALKPSTIAAKLGHNHSNDKEDGTHIRTSEDQLGKQEQRTERKRAEKEEKEQRTQAERQEVEHRRQQEDEIAAKEEDPEMRARYGDLEHPDEISLLDDVVKMSAGREVTFRARIHTQRSLSSKLDFVIFRHRGFTLQGVLSSNCSEHMIKWVERLPDESIVQVSGLLQPPPQPITASTDTQLELQVQSIHLVEPSRHIPFGLYHGEPPPQRSRLHNRTLDLRHPSNQAIFKIRSRILRVFRDTLDDLGFLEINTPKLQPAATESGAEVFRVNYFGRKAFLAQSPQLMKQMAISADFGRVYEIGPVFRAENSNTHRHLTEYTGLDIEMSLQQDYHEVFHVLETVMKNIFKAISSMKDELHRVREMWPSEEFKWFDQTPIIPFTEAVQMLRDDGRDVEEEDLSTPDEIRLGELVHQKYGADFYIVDRFPISARPFYTANDGHKSTNSFDMFVRGQEICTGGQRINDPIKLRESMREAGIPESDMEEYLSAFDWGMPPHGGAGLGLERIITFFLDLPDVRLASLFHRDPQSLPAKSASLPHPDADTTKPRTSENGDLPPLENLIANYGDATNTSWLDDRFKIWRDDRTGAAIGYVPQSNKFCMITGDPLCDEKQKKEVTLRFMAFVKQELKLRPVWMLVSEEMQDILANEYGWRTFSCTEEQRSDSDQADPELIQNNKEKKGVYKVKEVDASDEVFRKKCDERIEEWKAARDTKGKQVHLTEIAPWRDMEHRRYFVAEADPAHKEQSPEPNGASTKSTSNNMDQPVISTLVVLTRLSPSKGYQLKWALDFPQSPHGAIESTVQAALSAVPGEPVTFGAAVSENFVSKHGVGKLRARFMERTYRGIVKSMALDKKAGFRTKFGVRGEETYICFPKGGLKATELGEIVKFFE
ncbi:aspartate-tRNA(Asn) ligase [Kwoniella shandongensis]|uniref:Probable aspartate--tRNA ligase, cytoplasmic n=1 Tax=Kwoniella shandongensis TaxID=1734106 RepID=A0A5M6C7N9_9TREE|nr:aspartate-tRNA(Asn) ligase [Kwoniella shandongensis]KAA5530911.1 aspartate-tRNA(Asn) ligase [Kwoniella shandongensis]